MKKTISKQSQKKIEYTQIQLDQGTADGYLIPLSNTPLILVTTNKGYVMCGYLNMTTANKLGDIAGRVSGVHTIDDFLKAPIVELSDAAEKQGLTKGITAHDFLNKLV